MMFAGNQTREVRTKIIRGGKLIKAETTQSSTYPLNLQMYDVPPAEDITLTEFDDIALERLKVLKKVEDVKDKFTVGSEEHRKEIKKVLTSIFPIATGACLAVDAVNWRRRDIIGHFILRLAFCRTPELTKWLIQQEIDLFRFRFQNDTQSNICKFLAHHNIQLEPVTKDELDELSSELSAASGIGEAVVGSTNFWKIDFTEALELVRRRKVLLRGGMAYVPFDDLSSIVCGLLRANMAAAMVRSFKHLALLEEEGRILPRLARLANNAYSGKQYDGKENSDAITRHQIDQLCAASFAPCMKQIHQRLRGDHHLRHGARRQYGLFLKAIGLSLEEAMMFMREEFTKKMDSDKFDKQYAYNVRHMYGKEGRRSEYPAFPCSTIILSNPPAAGDCHGCPFKHTEHSLLAQRLERDGLSKEHVNKVMDLTKSNAFDKACTRFFEYSHKMEEGALGQLITHPNQFYELSTEVLAGKRSLENHIHSTQSQSVSAATPFAPSKSKKSIATTADDVMAEDMEWD